MANVCDWDIHQMDVKTAFLKGDVEDEIYMEQPEGFVNEERPDFVFKLNKNIYGSEQAAKCWNVAIDTFFMSSGYKKCGADPCVYTNSVKRKNGKIYFVIIALYVNDTIWLSNNTEMLEKEKLALPERFKVEDLGELTMFLVCLLNEIEDQEHFRLLRRNILKESLKRFDMGNCKPVSTLFEQGRKSEPVRYEKMKMMSCHIKWQLDV